MYYVGYIKLDEVKKYQNESTLVFLVELYNVDGYVLKPVSYEKINKKLVSLSRIAEKVEVLAIFGNKLFVRTHFCRLMLETLSHYFIT